MTSERDAHRDAHPDEGTIHAWLDRQLDDTSAATLETHLQRCDECAERVAEARGLIAGASRIVASLDDPSHAAAPRDALQLEHPAPLPPRALTLSHSVRFPAFRLTPARSAIAAVLVVAVGLAILNEHEHPTSKLAREQAREQALESAAAPSVGAARAPLVTPPAATVDTTAAERVAAARTFAKAQRETTVNADLARTRQLPAGAASPLEQTIAASKAADSVVGPMRNEAVNSPLLARRGVAGGVASGVAGGVAAGVAAGAARAPATAPAASAIEASQCYRVESATGAEASWGDVALPFVLALDAPATRNSARVLTADGRESDVRAVFERRGGDSLLFIMRRIGYTGSLAVGEPGDVRAGVMRSAPAALALAQTVVTAAPAAEPRRALRPKAGAAASREDSAAAAAQQRGAPAVPVVVRKVECGK